MNELAAAIKFQIEITYGGLAEPFTVESHEKVNALLHQAMHKFGITQPEHIFGLFHQDNTEVPLDQTVENAKIKPGELLVLKPRVVQGG